MREASLQATRIVTTCNRHFAAVEHTTLLEPIRTQHTPVAPRPEPPY